MRNFPRRRWVSVAVMGCLIAGLLTSPVLAQVITGEDDSLYYPDVDTAGNLDFFGGNRGVAKTFKFTRLNLLTAIATARCTNLSGKPQVYFNAGFPILDPQSFRYSVGKDVVSITGNQGKGQAFGTVLAIATPGTKET